MHASLPGQAGSIAAAINLAPCCADQARGTGAGGWPVRVALTAGADIIAGKPSIALVRVCASPARPAASHACSATAAKVHTMFGMGQPLMCTYGCASTDALHIFVYLSTHEADQALKVQGCCKQGSPLRGAYELVFTHGWQASGANGVRVEAVQ